MDLLGHVNQFLNYYLIPINLLQKCLCNFVIFCYDAVRVCTGTMQTNQKSRQTRRDQLTSSI